MLSSEAVLPAPVVFTYNGLLDEILLVHVIPKLSISRGT